MPRKHGEGGRFVTTVEGGDVLDVLAAVEGPVVTSADVADALDVTRETGRRKLNALVDDGTLAKRKTAGRVVYWRVDDSDESAESTARAGGTAGEDRAAGAGDDGEHRADSARESAGECDGETTGDDVDRALAALDTTDARRDAVRACVDLLRREGSAQKSDFVGDVYPDHPAGDQSEGGWWNKVGKEYLKAVADAVDAVKDPGVEGGHTWRWGGEDTPRAE